MIYALKTIGTGNDEYVQPKLFEEIKKGKARFGWSYENSSDLNQIEKTLKANNWDFNKLVDDQAEVWDKGNFLLNIKTGDYLVYINQPQYGYCTICLSQGEYSFDDGIHCDDFTHADDGNDFRHFIPSKFIGTFSREFAKSVDVKLYRRLVLLGRWWRIKTEEEFSSLLESVKQEQKDKKVDDQIMESTERFSEQKQIEETKNLSKVREPVNIFISYSRQDTKYLERLLLYFTPLKRQKLVDVWYDGEITAGEKWKENIYKAMEDTTVAILLVSTNFLASEFISTEELPTLLELNQKEGLVIKPIILNHCQNLLRYSELRHYNAVNSYDNPLSSMDDNEIDLIYDELIPEIIEPKSTKTDK